MSSWSKTTNLKWSNRDNVLFGILEQFGQKPTLAGSFQCIWQYLFSTNLCGTSLHVFCPGLVLQARRNKLNRNPNAFVCTVLVWNTVIGLHVSSSRPTLLDGIKSRTNNVVSWQNWAATERLSTSTPINDSSRFAIPCFTHSINSSAESMNSRSGFPIRNRPCFA